LAPHHHSNYLYRQYQPCDKELLAFHRANKSDEKSAHFIAPEFLDLAIEHHTTES